MLHKSNAKELRNFVNLLFRVYNRWTIALEQLLRNLLTGFFEQVKIANNGPRQTAGSA